MNQIVSPLVFLDLSVGVYIPLYVPVIYFREIPYFSVPRCSIRKGCSFQEPESGTEVEVGTMLGSGAQGCWDVVFRLSQKGELGYTCAPLHL